MTGPQLQLGDYERRRWREALDEYARTGFLSHVNHGCGGVDFEQVRRELGTVPGDVVAVVDEASEYRQEP